MKILQLCKKFPYPLKDGESIAVTYLSKALNQLGNQVTLLTMNTKKHYFDIAELPANYDQYQSIHFTDVDNEVKPFDAFLNLFSDDSYHISRFISIPFEQKLIEILKSEEFDFVQIETVHLAPYIPVIRRYSEAKISMRSHNVEFEIWQRIADNTDFLPKKWYINHLTKKLKKYEVNQLQNYDMMVAITQRDLDFFKKLGYKNKSVVTPIGLDINDYHPNFDTYNKAPSLSFIGALDWMPNYEGLMWFLENVWDQLIERFLFLNEQLVYESSEGESFTRIQIINFGLDNIKKFYLFGYGLGGFETLFQIYSNITNDKFANHAHSDLVQLFGELGLFGFILLNISLFKFFYNNFFSNSLNYLLIFFIIIFLLFDFSLHIPVIQILFIMFFILDKKNY